MERSDCRFLESLFQAFCNQHDDSKAMIKSLHQAPPPFSSPCFQLCCPCSLGCIYYSQDVICQSWYKLEPRNPILLPRLACHWNLPEGGASEKAYSTRDNKVSKVASPNLTHPISWLTRSRRPDSDLAGGPHYSCPSFPFFYRSPYLWNPNHSLLDIRFVSFFFFFLNTGLGWNLGRPQKEHRVVSGPGWMKMS